MHCTFESIHCTCQTELLSVDYNRAFETKSTKFATRNVADLGFAISPIVAS